MMNYNFTNNLYIGTDKEKKLLNKVHFKNNVFFLHYLGKNKPWSVEGIVDPISNFYQNEFRKLNIEKYHITFKKNKPTVKKFIKIILKLEFLKFERPGYYLFESLKKFFLN